MELDLAHRTNYKSAKHVWDAFHTLFGAVNTTQINRLETKLSNVKMEDIATMEEYISRLKNLKENIPTNPILNKSILFLITSLFHSKLLLSFVIAFLYPSKSDFAYFGKCIL